MKRSSRSERGKSAEADMRDASQHVAVCSGRRRAKRQPAYARLALRPPRAIKYRVVIGGRK